MAIMGRTFQEKSLNYYNNSNPQSTFRRCLKRAIYPSAVWQLANIKEYTYFIGKCFVTLHYKYTWCSEFMSEGEGRSQFLEISGCSNMSQALNHFKLNPDWFQIAIHPTLKQ